MCMYKAYAMLINDISLNKVLTTPGRIDYMHMILLSGRILPMLFSLTCSPCEHHRRRYSFGANHVDYSTRKQSNLYTGTRVYLLFYHQGGTGQQFMHLAKIFHVLKTRKILSSVARLFFLKHCNKQFGRIVATF